MVLKFNSSGIQEKVDSLLKSLRIAENPNGRCSILIALLVAGVVAFPVIAPVAAQPGFPEIDGAARAISSELRTEANCRRGNAPKVGIWPLDGDSLPIPDDNAVALYEAVTSALDATKPDCVTYVDGAGASDVLRYFILTGDGVAARATVEEAFQSVDYIVVLNVFARGSTIQAALRLSESGGSSLAAPRAFDVPDVFIGKTCGAGAVPLDRAVQVAARTLVDQLPDLTAMVDGGGTYADTGERTGLASYLGERLVGALVLETADNLSGRALRLVGEDGLGQAGVYSFSFRYWPCDDGSAATIAATLIDQSGKTAHWNDTVSLGGISGMNPPPPAYWSLSVTPGRVSVGDEVAFVADMPASCSPTFLDMTAAGIVFPLPLDAFQVENGPAHSQRYRSDASTPVGLAILPSDAKGIHFIGYVCSPEGLPSDSQLNAIWRSLVSGSVRRTAADDKTAYWFESYVVH